MRRRGVLLFCLFQPFAAYAANGCAPMPKFDAAALLAPPIAAGSLRAQQELRVVLAAQAARTPAASAEAVADAERSVFRFADALGRGFDPTALPKTAAFFACVAAADKAAAGQAKDYWRHPRPAVVSAAVHPLKPDRADDWGYPSGHATFAYSTAVLLAAMLPERRAALFDRADRYAHNRIVLGVHFPDDIEAGRLLGSAFGLQLLEDPAWRAGFAAARSEVRQALGLPAAMPR